MEDEWKEGSKQNALIGLGLFQEHGSYLCREHTVVSSIRQGNLFNVK